MKTAQQRQAAPKGPLALAQAIAEKAHYVACARGGFRRPA